MYRILVFFAASNTDTLIISLINKSDISKLNAFNQNWLHFCIRLNLVIFCLNIIFPISFIIFFHYFITFNRYNKGGNSHQNLIDKNTFEFEMKYDNDDKNSNSNIYPLIPEGLN